MGDAACTVHQTEPPGVSGPSTFAQSVNVTVTPDRIAMDGSSQSAVAVLVTGPDGRPVTGIALRVDMGVAGQLQDCGTLSARTIVTGNDGIAHDVYTAPLVPCVPSTSPVSTVTIRVIAFGSNAQTAVPSTADIRLVPPGVIVPPADTPTPQFTITPTPVNFNIPATFDASTSCPGPLTGGVCAPSSGSTSITSYSWTFGDGGTATGKTATHTYVNSTQPNTTFNVTLTVTNDRGISASTTQQVSVGASPAPSGDWVNSPVNPNVGDNVIFNADGVHAAAGHTIVQYSWNFGDGSTGSGFITTHVYTQSNTYTVVLSVLDDAGQKTVLPHQLTVGSGAPIVVITFSPSNPVHGNPITFDGTGTLTFGGATVASYSWSAPNGVPASGGGATFTTEFPVAGTYTVTLTVTDTASPPRTSRGTQTVTVQ